MTKFKFPENFPAVVVVKGFTALAKGELRHGIEELQRMRKGNQYTG